MKTVSGLFVVLLSLALLGAIFYGGYYAVQAALDYLAMLELGVRIILVSGILCVILASVIVAAAIKSSAKHAAMAPVTAQKLSLYKKLIEISFSVDRPTRELERLKADVLLLAGNAVTEVYEKIVAVDPAECDGRLEGLYSQLVKSIRQDLGHKTAVGVPRNWNATAVKGEIDLDTRRGL